MALARMSEKDVKVIKATKESYAKTHRGFRTVKRKRQSLVNINLYFRRSQKNGEGVILKTARSAGSFSLTKPLMYM